MTQKELASLCICIVCMCLKNRIKVPRMAETLAALSRIRTVGKRMKASGRNQEAGR